MNYSATEDDAIAEEIQAFGISDTKLLHELALVNFHGKLTINNRDLLGLFTEMVTWIVDDSPRTPSRESLRHDHIVWVANLIESVLRQMATDTVLARRDDSHE